VTNDFDNTVSIINTATNTVIDTVNVGHYPSGVAVTPDGSTVYVLFDGNVSVINTLDNTVTANISVGSPYGVAGPAVTPDDAADNNVYVITQPQILSLP